MGPVIKYFLYLPTQKYKKLRKNYSLDAGWDINFPWFQGARLDHVRVQSLNYCFPIESLSFVRPRKLVSFDPGHVARSPPMGKRI